MKDRPTGRRQQRRQGALPLGKAALPSAQRAVPKGLWAAAFLVCWFFFKEDTELILHVAPAQPRMNLTHFTCICVTLLKMGQSEPQESWQLRGAPWHRAPGQSPTAYQHSPPSLPISGRTAPS